MRPGLIAIVLLLALPASSAAVPRYFGFNDNAPVRGDLTAAQDARLAKGAGANSQRITIAWSWVEHAPGTLDLSIMDEIYREQTRRGIRPLFIVTGAPRWAWNPWTWCVRGRTCHHPPGRLHDRAFGRFAAAVARRFPRAAAIEVWNEPNLRFFWEGSPDPARYTELLKAAYTAVKAVDPDMPVLGGSLVGEIQDLRADQIWGVTPYLQAMLAAGAGDFMDGLSLHPYPRDDYPDRMWEGIRQVRRLTRLPLWITEVGVSTHGGYTPEQQAAVLADAVRRLRQQPDVAGLYLHTLADPVNRPAAGAEGGYGIVGKPAYCAVARAVGVPCRG